MNRKEYEYLQEQMAGLDDLLEMVPADAVGDRISLQSRRDRVAAKLAECPAPERRPAKARLTFNGHPVAAGGGIAVDFANRAVKEFADAVAAVGASQHGLLGDRGPFPQQENYRLLITGTVAGASGFELEEDIERSEHTAGESPVEAALERVGAIFKSLSGSDETLAAALSEMHPRAIKNLRDFLEVLAANKATCALAFKGDVFRFKDVGQVKRSLNRLGPDSILESDDKLSGVFLGYLPDSRRAEFRNGETGEVISGRIDVQMHNADAINDHLEQPVRLNVRVRRVGEGRPRYTFMDYAAV